MPIPFLAIFATGKKSGLVVDIGAKETTITPVLCYYHDRFISKNASFFVVGQFKWELQILIVSFSV